MQTLILQYLDCFQGIHGTEVVLILQFHLQHFPFSQSHCWRLETWQKKTTDGTIKSDWGISRCCFNWPVSDDWIVLKAVGWGCLCWGESPFFSCLAEVLVLFSNPFQFATVKVQNLPVLLKYVNNVPLIWQFPCKNKWCFQHLLELSAATIDLSIRDFPHLWIFKSVLLNLTNPSRSC